jgi:hypothetical protein
MVFTNSEPITTCSIPYELVSGNATRWQSCSHIASPDGVPGKDAERLEAWRAICYYRKGRLHLVRAVQAALRVSTDHLHNSAVLTAVTKMIILEQVLRGCNAVQFGERQTFRRNISPTLKMKTIFL